VSTQFDREFDELARTEDAYLYGDAESENEVSEVNSSAVGITEEMIAAGVRALMEPSEEIYSVRALNLLAAEAVVKQVLGAALAGRKVVQPAPRDQVYQTIADVRDACERTPRDVDTADIIDSLVAGGFLVLAPEEVMTDWCNCQAVRGTANYPGPWHPKGDPVGCLKHGSTVASGSSESGDPKP
jgi:hypothetical protein